MRNWFSSSSPTERDAAVAEVVDVVGPADVALQPEQVRHDAVDVLRRQRPGVLGEVRLELDVELEAAHAREVVLLRVEEHAVEEVLGRLVRRRIAGAQAPVDLEDRLVLGLVGVLADRVDEDVAAEVPVGEEDLDVLDPALLQLLDARRARLPGRPRRGPRPVERSTTSAMKQAFSTAASSTERSTEPFFAISFWSSADSLMPAKMTFVSRLTRA